jgi:hypothetical protein
MTDSTSKYLVKKDELDQASLQFFWSIFMIMFSGVVMIKYSEVGGWLLLFFGIFGFVNSAKDAFRAAGELNDLKDKINNS